MKTLSIHSFTRSDPNEVILWMEENIHKSGFWLTDSHLQSERYLNIMLEGEMMRLSNLLGKLEQAKINCYDGCVEHNDKIDKEEEIQVSLTIDFIHENK